MREIFALTIAEAMPDHEAVKSLQGMRPESTPPPRVAGVIAQALQLLSGCAEPAALAASVTATAFAEIYRGEGRNAVDSPLARIYPRADALVLFALTLGSRVSDEINRLFEEREFALAAMLDSAASAGAEFAVRAVEQRVLDKLRQEGVASSATAALSYSPGYCGWDVSGQRALFAALRPEEIGITLNESFLMVPLKSVSGVIVAGPAAIHEFAADYEFCRPCRSRECRARIRRAHGE